MGDAALVEVLLGDGAQDGRLAAAEFAVADAQSLADTRFLRSLGEVELVFHVRAMGSLHRVIAPNAHQMTMAERADADLPPALEFARAGALRLAQVNPRVWIASGIVLLLVLGGWGGYVLISGLLAPDEAPPPDLRGTFMVRFEESTDQVTERAFIEDQTTRLFEYDISAIEGWAIAEVWVSVHFDETDELGLALCDDVSANLVLSNVVGGSEFGGLHEGSSFDCNDPEPQIVLNAVVNPEYDGQDYSEENVLVEDLEKRWQNGGRGIGTFVNEVTVEINTALDFREQGEEVEVTWTVVSYRWIIETATE